MNYYERHIGDYLKDTAHLSLLEHGVYGRLLDVYYTREGPLPVNQVDRLIGVRSRSEHDALNVVLDEFFTVDGDVLRHPRCEREIARYQDKQEKAKRSANARWENKTQHTERNANAMRTHSEGNALQTPVTRHQTPDKNTTPDGVSDSVWQDFKTLRAKLRAPITATSMAGIVREAEKAGVTLEVALRTCCERGWRGFKADWMVDKGLTVAAVTVPSRMGVDPAIAKAIADARNAVPPSESVRAKLAELRTRA
jgi:uncharacterized protein YdaU (DUF1376 family)